MPPSPDSAGGKEKTQFPPTTSAVSTKRRAVAPFELDQVEFLVCLRTARRGAATGPSGMTPDHIFTLLESEHDS